MKAIIWSKYNCPNCDQAKAILQSKGYAIQEYKISDGYTKEELLVSVPTARSVPQIFLDEKYIGGLSELKAHLQIFNETYE